MEDLAQHILDIVENSLTAGAGKVHIALRESQDGELRVLTVIDDGMGMDETIRLTALSPFVSTRTERRIGLGLSLLEQSAAMTGGGVQVESMPGRGTKVSAQFAANHIDCVPLGDLEATFMALLAGHPETRFSIDLAGAAGNGWIASSEILSLAEPGLRGYRFLNAVRGVIRRELRRAGFSTPPAAPTGNNSGDEGA